MPLHIYLAESPASEQPRSGASEEEQQRIGRANMERIAGEVSETLRNRGRAMIVISEGFYVGSLGHVRDSFGHEKLGSSQMTACQKLVNYLNHVGLPVKGDARGNVPGTDQRHAIAYASTVDLDEAYGVGRKAAELAAAGASGFMATLLREPGPTYNIRYDRVPLADVAGSERTFPQSWIAECGADVTDDFVRYARPLVGDEMVTLPMVDGRQRMTRFEPIYADKKLPEYVPQADRIAAT
jgi:6-phosphofructokinase 1